MNTKILTAVILTTLVFSFAIFNEISAATYGITGNGTGSENTIKIEQTNTTTTNQSNTANINNNIDANCNTGGNSASGNTGGNTNVNTGNCAASVNVTNCVNTNNGSLNCPTLKPSATPTSTPPTGGPGGPGGNGGGGSSGGGGGSSAASSAGGPQVLGQAGILGNLTAAAAGISLILTGLLQAQRAAFKRD